MRLYSALIWSIAVGFFGSTACRTADDETVIEVLDAPEFIELFRLGNELEGDSVLFGRVGELLAVDGSGRIFIGDHQVPVIHVFNRDGVFQTSIGQSGSAPGEFSRIQSIHVEHSDSLYVFDFGLNRISVFDTDQFEIQRSISVSQDSLGLPFSLLGSTDTGFLMTYGWPISPGDASEDRYIHVTHVGWAAEMIDLPIHSVQASEWLTSSEGEQIYAIRIPFGRKPVLRKGSSGNLYSGWTDSLSISIFSLDGILQHSINHSLKPVTLTRSELELAVEGRSDWVRDAIINADLADFKPVYDHFIVDDLEQIWLRTTPPSIADSTVEWLVFNEKGHLSHRFHLPVSTNLLEIRDDRVYAVDSQYGDQVIVYQLKKSELNV
ncbi:MAG: 6-bladed beta-propeller [Bacteroidetes bacterium]|nr:6-bladed beta-propeller [Bacteroidota bacterium]